jgi:uncharacterized protein
MRLPAQARALARGSAEGVALVLDETLSFWGGLDARTGRLVDPRHPQVGAEITGRILVMPAGRGSSSSPSVLAEAIRAGTGPAGIVLREADAVVALGAIVAAELYGIRVPVVVVGAGAFASLTSGMSLTVRADGADGVIEAR